MLTSKILRITENSLCVSLFLSETLCNAIYLSAMESALPYNSTLIQFETKKIYLHRPNQTSKMLRRALPLSFMLLISCIGIQVDKGPFDIPVSKSALREKEEYLTELSKFELSDSVPNILIILVDDLSKYDISVYGDYGVQTPNIQRLANEGITFTNAFSSSPVCSPSRAGLFTGRYQQRYGFERQPMNRYAHSRMEYFFVDHFMNVEPMRLVEPMAAVPNDLVADQGIPPEEILLPEILQSAGYETGICGKWHLGNDTAFRPNHRGFHYQFGFYEAFTLYAPLNTMGIVEYRHDYFANKHIWKQKRKGSCAIRVNDEIINEEEYLTFAIARKSLEFIRTNREKPFFLVSAFNAPHTPFQVPREYYDRFSYLDNHNLQVYYGMIAALDDAVGMILNGLSELGLDENTLIIFASDNGGATYTGATENGPLQAGKFSQFEGGINIPMLFSWKGNIPGTQVFSQQVSLLDIFPTILRAAGINPPAKTEVDGAELTGLVSDSVLLHKYLYWRTDYNKAIRSDKWKLIWNTRDRQEWLYDLSVNNFEQKNLAKDYPDTVNYLKEAYYNWEKQMVEPSWPGVMEFRFMIDSVETWWAI